MSLSGVLNGLTGAMGLYSGVKGLFDSADAEREQKRILADAKAEEAGWFRRNYYGNYLDNVMARAAIKRVEQTLHDRNRQNRAYAAVNGATPEYALAQNAQGLRSMENVMSGLAAQEDARRMNVENAHRQNMSAFRNYDYQRAAEREQMAGNDLLGGMQLLKSALEGADWGKEENVKEDNYGKGAHSWIW